MPKVSDAHRASRHDQIINAALVCFSRNGFHRTSMADIIEEAGLSAGAIYLHFAGKQDIVWAVAKRVLGTRSRELEAVISGPVLPPPVDLLRLLMDGLTRDLTDTGLLVQLWGEAVVDSEIGVHVTEVFTALERDFRAYLTAWVTQSRDLDQEASAAWALTALPAMLALGQGYLLQRALLPDFDSDRYFAAVAALLAD